MKYNGRDYRTSHLGHSFTKQYDDKLFKPGVFDAELWKREQQVLERIISKYSIKGRLLDFACGTGRIITHLENHFDESIGLDISQDMLEHAKVKIKNSTLICGDVTRDHNLVEGKFDCITSFRFFLNAEDSLRREVLEFITNKLRSAESIFIFNIHGNTFSTRCFMAAFHKLLLMSQQNPSNQGKVTKIMSHALRVTPSFDKTNHMSIKEVRQMLKPYNLEIVEFYGVGHLHEVFYRIMPAFLWKFIEDICYSFTFLKAFSLYPIFITKKSS